MKRELTKSLFLMGQEYLTKVWLAMRPEPTLLSEAVGFMRLGGSEIGRPHENSFPVET